MPQHRVPTSVLAARGAFKNHPSRAAERVHEPIPVGELGPPPKYLTKEEKKVWKELASIIPEGVAFTTDRWIVETAVVLMAKQRARTILCSERNLLVNCLSKMAMTPSDRSRVHAAPAEKPKEANPWDMLSAPAQA
jgi:hypothetical protein